MMEDRAPENPYWLLFQAKDMLDEISNLIVSSIVSGKFTHKLATILDVKLSIGLGDLQDWADSIDQSLIDLYEFPTANLASLRLQLDHAERALDRAEDRDRIQRALMGKLDSPFWNLHDGVGRVLDVWV